MTSISALLQNSSGETFPGLENYLVKIVSSKCCVSEVHCFLNLIQLIARYVTEALNDI